MTWGALFETAATHGVSLEAVRETVTRRRAEDADE